MGFSIGNSLSMLHINELKNKAGRQLNLILTAVIERGLYYTILFLEGEGGFHIKQPPVFLV